MTELSCHCGAVVLDVTLADPQEEARRCDCSYCRRRAAATLTVREEDLRIVRGEDVLTRYRFHSETAEHFFCSICGIYTHHRRRIDPRVFGVNFGALAGVTPEALRVTGWVDGINHPSDRES